MIEAALSLHRNTASAPISSTVAKRLVGWFFEEHVADDRVAGDVVRLRLIVDLLLDQRRPDIAGADRVGGDAVLGAFQRDHLGEADHAVLGGDIGRLERRGDQAVRRGDVDDAAVAALAIGSKVAWIRWKAADRLIARIASHFSAGNSPIGATCWMPALLTTMSTWPKRATARSTIMRMASRLRHVGAVVGDIDIVVVGQRGALRLDLGRIAETVQHDRGAALRQGTGDAEADAAGRAGHDGGAAFERAAAARFRFRFA